MALATVRSVNVVVAETGQSPGLRALKRDRAIKQSPTAQKERLCGADQLKVCTVTHRTEII